MGGASLETGRRGTDGGESASSERRSAEAPREAGGVSGAADAGVSAVVGGVAACPGSRASMAARNSRSLCTTLRVRSRTGVATRASALAPTFGGCPSTIGSAPRPTRPPPIRRRTNAERQSEENTMRIDREEFVRARLFGGILSAARAERGENEGSSPVALDEPGRAGTVPRLHTLHR